MLLKDALDTYARSLKKEWSHDRTKTVGASEIGQCHRRVAFSKQNATKDSPIEDYGALMRGNVVENEFWVPAMRKKYGDNIIFAGNDQHTFVGDFLSATPDGLLINQPRDILKEFGINDMGSDCLVVECKSVDPRVELSKEKTVHKHQTIVQMGLIREHTDFEPNYALITYVDASFWDEISEFVVAYDDHAFQMSKVRAKIMMTKDPMELSPEGAIEGGKDCRHCPYTTACKSYLKNFPEKTKELEKIYLDELDALCETYNTISGQLDELTIEKNACGEEIKKFLREHDTRKVPGYVTYSLTKARVTYDTPALVEAAKKAGVDVQQFERSGEPSERLLVKR